MKSAILATMTVVLLAACAHGEKSVWDAQPAAPQAAFAPAADDYQQALDRIAELEKLAPAERAEQLAAARDQMTPEVWRSVELGLAHRDTLRQAGR